MHNKILTETKKNLVKRKLTCINTFDHQGTAVVRVMHDITRKLFEQLDIISTLDVYKRVNYTQIILRVAALNKYKTVLEDFKYTAKGIAVDQWTLSEAKDVTMEQVWTWTKQYGTDANRNYYLGMDKCINFDKDIWFKLGKSMRKKHWSVFQDHVKYIHNDIVKPFRVGILQYAQHVR